MKENDGKSIGGYRYTSEEVVPLESPQASKIPDRIIIAFLILGAVAGTVAGFMP